MIAFNAVFRSWLFVVTVTFVLINSLGSPSDRRHVDTDCDRPVEEECRQKSDNDSAGSSSRLFAFELISIARQSAAAGSERKNGKAVAGL